MAVVYGGLALFARWIPEAVFTGNDGMAAAFLPIAHPLYYGLGFLLALCVLLVLGVAWLINRMRGSPSRFMVTGPVVALGVAAFTGFVLIDDRALFDPSTALPLDTFKGGGWAGFGAAIAAGALQTKLINRDPSSARAETSGEVDFVLRGER